MLIRIFYLKSEDVILFGSHSLLKDPPFSRLDLISCRMRYTTCGPDGFCNMG